MSTRILGALVAVAFVLAGTDPDAAAQERKKAEPKDGSTVRGTIASVDADKSSITITVRAFDRKTAESTETNKTFAVAKDAKILQDDAAARLADLKKGHPTFVKLDNLNAVAITVDGGTAEGEFRSANTERNTITVIAGRDMARRVYHLLKTTSVMGTDDKPIRIEDLKPGARLQLTRSVEDGNTVIRVRVMPDREKRK